MRFKKLFEKLFFGVTMIFFAPVGSTTLTVIKRVGRPLLALPFCVLLISCDSASSNTDNNGMRAKVTSTENIEQFLNNSQDNNNRQSNTGNETDKVAQGQSLIAAAQSRHDTNAPSSLVDAELHSNTLQATLMGDYIGTVTCPSCDSINIALNLFSDGSVLKTSIYNNPKEPQPPLLESGIYRQDDDKITIVYADKHIETYQIQGSHLVLIGEDKTLNDDYTLSRK